MDYDNLKDAVKAVIKQNGNQEITGDLLQAVLLSIISNVGEYAGLVGQANPATVPGNHDGPVFFVATEPGTYVNFGNKTIKNFSIFYTRGDGSDWEVIEMEDKIIPPATEDIDGLLTAEQKKALDNFRISFDPETNKLLLVYTSLENGEENAIEVPVATQEVNGLLGADKLKILNNFAISFDSSETSTGYLKLVYRSLRTGEGVKINVPVATSSVNGLLSALQKRMLDKFTIYITNNADGELQLKYQMLDRDSIQTVTIPLATDAINGLISATQKKALDTFSISFQNILNVPLLKYTDLVNGATKTVVIPAASETSNGLMSATDKKKLDSLSPKEELFIDMWNSACGAAGKYNRDTGYYELNGLTDITYEQALKIYQNTEQTYLSQYSTELFYGNPIIRTNICPNVNSNRGVWVRIDSTAMFSGNNAIEVVAVSQSLNTNISKWSFNNVNYMFNGCIKLKKIIGGIFNFGITAENRQRSVFVRCSLLNRVLIEGIIVSLSFSDSPLISYESLKYLVDNAANTAAITITVHATTYSYLTGELEPTDVVGGTMAEWQQLMTDATAKNISFAKLS